MVLEASHLDKAHLYQEETKREILRVKSNRGHSLKAIFIPKISATILWFSVCLIPVGFLLGGCAPNAPNMMDPKGGAAAAIANLGWLLFGLGGVVYIGVMIFLFASLFRRRHQEEGGSGDGVRIVLFGGVIIPVIILIVVYGSTLVTMAALRTPDDLVDDVVIEVIGHQWWWEVHYPNQHFTTANEIHIPVGQPVEVVLASEDVIHSFWVPELHGKLDLIPGDITSFWLEADEAGVFWGECAEFCGIQHAKMQFVVVAEPAEQFFDWMALQQLPAPEPADPLVREGQQIFLGSACVYCHTIEGTNASGDLGPDLTHLASRRTLAAGVLENNIGNLGGWIIDPQHVKPGNLMPPTNLSGEELQALLAYLATLE